MIRLRSRIGALLRLTSVSGAAAAVGIALATMPIAAPMVAAQAKSKVTYAMGNAFDNLDPHVIFDVGRIASRLNMYDGLLRWLDNPPKLQPWLAESYEITNDGKTYSFKLRKGAKFHDGSDIEAEDVVWSMERILALNKGPAALFTDIIAPRSTKAIDKHTVQFNLSKQSAIFLATVPDILVINADLVKKNIKDGDWGQAWLSRNDAGSGSFKLTRYDPAIGFVGARFAEHFIPWGKKYIDEVEFRTVNEINSRVLGLIRGDFQGVDGFMQYDQILRMKESGKLAIHEEESMRIFYGAIHNARSPMNDINFRKALSYAFDYDGFNNNILSGSVIRAPAPIPNNIWGAPKGLKGYSYDLEKAKEYLTKVKEPLREITIGALAGYGQTEQAAALLQAGLTKIGVKSKILAEPWPVVQPRTFDEKQMYDVLFTWKSTYYADPHNWVGEMYGSDTIGSRNNSWYRNPEVDKLIREALVSTDMERRREIYEKVSTIVVDDAAGIFVYNTKWFGPMAKNLKGLRFSPVGVGLEARWLYYE